MTAKRPIGALGRDYKFSRLREKIVEHIFVGQLLQHLWQIAGDRVGEIEVLKSEFDAHGYDVVLSFGNIIRHVQLKTGKQKKPVRIKVASQLANKQGGCLIWIGVNENLDFLSYFWFGGLPGTALPITLEFKTAKANRFRKGGLRPERRGHLVIPNNAFVKLGSLEEVISALFGNDLASNNVK